MLDVGDVSPKTYPDDSWVPAPPHLPSNPPPEFHHQVAGLKVTKLNLPHSSCPPEVVTNED